jgi:hypothetical protein
MTETEHRRNERLIAHWTRVLGVFTIVLALVGIATSIILYETDQTSRLRDRAFVYFTDPSFFKWPTINPNVLAVTMHVINAGNMPARRVAIKFNCPIPLKTDVADPYKTTTWATSEAPNVIGAKQPLDLQSCNIPLDAFDKARGGTNNIFIMFEASYFDGFDFSERRITQMSRSFRYDFDGGTSWGYVAPHNCTDDDCPN